MKAIVKDTLEIVDVRLANDGNGYYYKGVGVYEGKRYYCSDIEELEVDWEQRRFELAKEILVAIVGNGNYTKNSSPGDLAKLSIDYAETMIYQLNSRNKIGTITE